MTCTYHDQNLTSQTRLPKIEEHTFMQKVPRVPCWGMTQADIEYNSTGQVQSIYFNIGNPVPL